MNKEFFGKILKYIITVILSTSIAAGIGWNMWLTNQVTANTVVDTEQAKQLSADEVRFQYIAEALTRIENKMSAEKP